MAAPTVTSWISPEQAYATAPDINDEVDWLAKTADDCEDGLDREWSLRHAAVLDRIALEKGDVPGEASEEAMATALLFQDDDRYTNTTPGGPHPPDHPAAQNAPRNYVRQEYAAYRRQVLIEQGRCPHCCWLQYQCSCADHPDA